MYQSLTVCWIGGFGSVVSASSCCLFLCRSLRSANKVKSKSCSYNELKLRENQGTFFLVMYVQVFCLTMTRRPRSTLQCVETGNPSLGYCFVGDRRAVGFTLVHVGRKLYVIVRRRPSMLFLIWILAKVTNGYIKVLEFRILRRKTSKNSEAWLHCSRLLINRSPNVSLKVISVRTFSTHVSMHLSDLRTRQQSRTLLNLLGFPQLSEYIRSSAFASTMQSISTLIIFCIVWWREKLWDIYICSVVWCLRLRVIIRAIRRLQHFGKQLKCRSEFITGLCVRVTAC